MNVNELITKSREFADELDQYRCPWEGLTHWNVRKNFLRHNWENFKDKDRLICLSQAWVNVHFSGNRYPQDVMDELKRLEEGLDKPDKMLRDAELQVIGKVAHTSQKVISAVHNLSKLPHTITPMQFVKQGVEQTYQTSTDNSKSETESTTSQIFCHTDDTPKNVIDYKVFKHTKDSNQTDKSSTVTESASNNLQSNKLVEDVTTKSGNFNLSSNCMKETIILDEEGKNELKALVIRQRNDILPFVILHNSVSFCKLSQEYIFETEHCSKGVPAFCCSVLINGVLVGRTRATDKKSAKHAAAEAALKLLRKICPTILESRPGNLEAALSRKDVIKRHDEATTDKKIEGSNVGNRMLRKMGWKSDTGLGKTGSGIVVPVSVTESYKRAGLGSLSSNKLITFKNAYQVISKYASSESQDEVTFSPELASDERAKIHKIASRFGLRSKSYNKDNIRYLVVSRKRTASTLVQELEISGGMIGSAKLLKPGEILEDS